MASQEDRHWLDDPAHLRLPWRGFLVVLALTLAAEFVIHLHPQFEIDSVFGFAAWFGFAACAAMVAVAKGLALWLQRPDTYYDDSDD